MKISTKGFLLFSGTLVLQIIGFLLINPDSGYRHVAILLLCGVTLGFGSSLTSRFGVSFDPSHGNHSPSKNLAGWSIFMLGVFFVTAQTLRPSGFVSHNQVLILLGIALVVALIWYFIANWLLEHRR